jgi:hypothetical protein
VFTASQQFVVSTKALESADKIELLDEVSQTKIVVAGRSLESQFIAANKEHLLILTDDCPFEETLRVVLLSPELKILDELEHCSAYESLVIEDAVALTDESESNRQQIQINCAQQQPLFVELLDQPLGLLTQLSSKLSNQVVSNKKRIVLTFE